MSQSRKKSGRKAQPHPELEALISRVYGAYYELRTLPDLDEEFSGQLRGKLRLASRSSGKKYAGDPYGDALRERHLLIVGDRVRYRKKQADAEFGGDAAMIDSLVERKNAVYRSTTSELHALGANLDRAIVLMSLSQPRPRWGFIDRFFASCHAGGVNPCVVFSKPDLVEAEDAPDIERMIGLYREGLGYPVFVIDLLREEPAGQLQALREYVADGVTLLAGQSGTGKSTLSNLLLGDVIQPTGQISESTGKGRHTTTNSRMLRAARGSARGGAPGDDPGRMLIIDTPGVKEWGVQHLQPAELLESFPEIAPVTDECRFRDCAHGPEQKGCAVMELIERSRQVYSQYFENIEEIEDNPDVAVPPWSEECVHPERLRSLDAMLESLHSPLKIRTGDFIKPTGRKRPPPIQ